MAAQDKIKQEVLPIPEKPCVGLSTFTSIDPKTRFPPYEPLRPPEGAPNVLKILLDDGGFGASSAFGGPVNTPTHTTFELWRWRTNKQFAGNP